MAEDKQDEQPVEGSENENKNQQEDGELGTEELDEVSGGILDLKAIARQTGEPEVKKPKWEKEDPDSSPDEVLPVIVFGIN